MTLAESQQLFWDLITRSPGAEREKLGAVFAGTPELPAAERVEIYAEMYFFRQVDALRETFPKLAEMFGEDAFAELVREYLRAWPSDHPDIDKLGRQMEAFLRERAARWPRPDLADLAALEWARSRVFDEAPAEPVGQDALRALSPEAFAAARLRFIPALRRVAVAHDVAPVWRALDDEREPPPPRAAPASLLVWRRGFEVFHATAGDDEALALARAQEGRPLAEVCDAFARCEAPAEAALRALASWFGEGLVAAVRE